MRKIGFTGTREGMSEKQKEAFKAFISSEQFNEFHHGDCVGSDKEAHDIVSEYREESGNNIKIVGHPPKYNKYRAYCKVDLSLSPKDYLTRNHDIVDISDVLVATPCSKERLHSGTWATIRYARKKDEKIFIFNLSGKLKQE